MKICQACGSASADDATRCESCGAPAYVEAQECARCGEQIAARAESCPACGHLFVEEACALHAERTALGECVICGTTLCEECGGSERGSFVCAEHLEVPMMGGWAQVYSTSRDLEANLISENLHAQGVDSRVLSQKDHFSVPVDLGDLSPVRVLVPAFAYLQALDLIQAHQSSAGEVIFACPACGEGYDGGEAVCSSCGEPLPIAAAAEPYA